MLLSFGWCVVLIAHIASADKCNPSGLVKRLQQYSPCAHRTELGVLIGFGYNLNLPYAKSDLAFLGIDRNDIPKGIITQTYSECDCEKSVCLSLEQSELLFDISIDRARKQVSSLISLSTTCCDIQEALTGLFYTFGEGHLRHVPDLLLYVSTKRWQKLGKALLLRSWCKSSDRCKHLAERIVEGCNGVNVAKLGCSPPTPKACDPYGNYCCATNNTCCQYALQKHNTVFSSRFNQAYWCCPLTGAVCCTGSTGCCSSKYPVCCGATNSCCYVEYPVCCFPGTSRAYCCAASSPVCLGESKCGSLDPDVEPVEGKKSNRR